MSLQPIHRVLLLMVFLTLGQWPIHAQTPQISVTFPGRADSIFGVTSHLFRDRHYTLVRLDTASLTVEAVTADSPSVRVVASHRSLGDSTHVTISAEGGEVRSLGILMELANSLRPRPNGPPHSAPDGAAWPTDAKGRVGFLVLTRAGARFLRMKPGDTLPEIRPKDLPQAYRHAWENEINDVGFDASCARFFRAGTGYVVRFNFCTAPTPDGDRFDVYDAEGGFFGVTIGETVGTYIQAMCPATRPPWPALRRSATCPAPF